MMVPGAAVFHLGGDESGLVRRMLSMIREQAVAEDAACFSVAEHNKNQVHRVPSSPSSKFGRYEFYLRSELCRIQGVIVRS